MPKHLYWCSDSAIRGCLLRAAFQKLGHVVEIPSAGPHSGTGRVPRRGSTYPLQEATRLLASHGAKELAEIDRVELCRETGVRGEIDLAARLSGSGRIIVAEVKTRIIPMEIKRSGARWRQVLGLMLRYHLDEPKEAYEAWRRLVEMGVVKPPTCGKPRKGGGYDNPASIAELVRETAGYIAISGTDAQRVIPAAVVLCSIDGLIDEVENYVKRAAEYMSTHNIGDGAYAVLIVGPDRYSEPTTYWIDCRGSACDTISSEWPLNIGHSIAYHDGCPSYLACRDCRYRVVCSAYCLHRSSTPRQVSGKTP